MLRVKYGDKRYLCEYDLNTDLFKEFNIEVNDLVPVRSVYVLQTNKGKKILKKLNYGSKRLNFICCALDFIEKSYKNIMKINKNINDENFVCRNGSRYILIDLIEGRECTTSNPVDIEASSKALANLHNSSIGFFDMIKGNEDFKDYIDIYNLEVNLKESLKDLNDFKKQVSRYSYKNEFDNLFYENVDYYIDEINYCIDYLKIIDINKIVNDNKKIVLCHNDLAHHNILIRQDEVYFIDFDYCKVDFRVKDLSNMIIKSIKNYDYDYEKFYNILSSYESINKLNKEEYKLLYLLMRYPKDFYMAAKNYYLKEKNWEEEVYYWRFFNKVQHKESRKEFLDRFFYEYI